MQVIARDCAKTLGRDVERNDGRLACIQHNWREPAIHAARDDIQRDHAFGQIATEAEHLPDREGFDRRIEGQFAMIDDLDAADTGKCACTNAIERNREFRLPPELRHQRDHESGAKRGHCGQHELDGVGHLHGNDRARRQAGFDKAGGNGGYRLIGLREGQLCRRIAGHAQLVGRIDQRDRIGLAQHGAAKQVVERQRRAG